MFYRIYPTKDAFITNYVVNGNQMTGSNTGGSEILYLFKLYSAPQSGSKSHILMQFNTSSFPAATSASYTLKLFNCQHGETLPFGYTAIVRPIFDEQWSEGSGHDLDKYSDVGSCNWLSSSAGVAWVVPGGYPSGSLSSSFLFDSGDEDLETDVTSIMPTAHYGFFVQLPISLETDANDYWIKMFHGRHTSYLWRRPYLEMRWEDWTGDLTGFSGTVDPTGTLTTIVYDLKPDYYTTEDVTLHLSVYPKNWNPAVVTTASSDASGSILTNAYYRIVDDRTDQVVVPFGTGSQKYTKLSYDATQGNFFRLRMGNLVEGSVYRLEFLYNSGTNWTQIRPDNQYKFRVR